MVVIILAVAAITRRQRASCASRGTRRRDRFAAVVPAPVYAHQLATYDSALFGSRIRPSLSRHAVRLGFFVGAGLPEVVTEPLRPSFSRQFLPIAYAETWGDYFGVWRWLPSGGKTASDVRRELVTMSIVGLPLTLMAVAGWIALLALAIRHPGRATERQLIALLPLAALAGVSISRRPTRRPTATP